MNKKGIEERTEKEWGKTLKKEEKTEKSIKKEREKRNQKKR